MADLTNTIRDLWTKGIETIGNAANSVADSAHNKADELQLQSRRKDIMSSFASVAYEQYKLGAKFPPACEQLLKEVAALDEELAARKQSAKPDAAPEKKGKSAPSLQVPSTPSQLVPGHLVRGLGPVPSMAKPAAPAEPAAAAAPSVIIDSVVDEIENEIGKDTAEEAIAEIVDAVPEADAVQQTAEKLVSQAEPVIDMIITSSEDEETTGE